MQLIFNILNYLPFNLKMLYLKTTFITKKCYGLGYQKPNWVKKMNFFGAKKYFSGAKKYFSGDKN